MIGAISRGLLALRGGGPSNRRNPILLFFDELVFGRMERCFSAQLPLSSERWTLILRVFVQGAEWLFFDGLF
jgi:hypothetical protein